MLLKKAVYKKVKVMQNKLVSEEIYGCDECQLVLDYNDEKTETLEVAVHLNGGDYSRKIFCSWECVFKHLPKMKSDYFISLPFLNFDRKKNSPCGHEEFFKIIKKLNK